jgi:hypothetical protein
MRDRVEANARLTGSVAIVLLLPLALVVASGLAVRRFLLAHALIGFLLIPPLLLKLGSVGYRFVRYYTGDRAYRAAGPPRPAMRWLGAVTVILTLVVFGTGGELWLFAFRFGFAWAPVHHASAYLWFIAMLVHVINYLRQAPLLALGDWRDRWRSAMSRQALVAASLVLGIALAAVMLPFATPFVLPAGGG